MKICYLARSASTHMVRFVRFFVEQGHEVTIISLSWDKIDKMEGVTLRTVKADRKTIYFLLPFVIKKFQTIIDEIKPDIVHAQYLTTYGVILAALNVKKKIVTTWGSDLMEIYQNPVLHILWEKVRKYVISKMDIIQIGGLNLRSRCLTLGASEDQLLFIPFGVEIENYGKHLRDTELIKSWGGESISYIISIRNFYPIYDIETIIKAVPKIIEKHPNVKFILAGDGIDREKLEKQVEELNISNFVHFCGFISREAIPIYLASSDVYISTCLLEGGLGASNAEALATGLPVVIVEGNDIKYWIKEDINGYLIKKRDYEGLVKKVDLILSNKGKIEIIGNNNRELVKNYHDYKTLMFKIEEIYFKMTVE